MLSRGTSLFPSAFAVVCCACVAAEHAAARSGAQPREYDLPAGDAADTLRRFATASGVEIVFLVENVRGERTRAVLGRLPPREALERMLQGTALVMSQDPATGAFFVGRKRSGQAMR